MSPNSLHTPGEVQSLILSLTAPPIESDPSFTLKSIEASGQAALALALAYGVDEPNAIVDLDYRGEVRKPLLLSALYTWSFQQEAELKSPESPRLPFSLDPSEDWPPGASELPARERLALLLVRNGADPWLKDDGGMDAMDWAVRAGSRSLVALLLKHPGCPPLDELQKRTLTLSGRRVPWLHYSINKSRPSLFLDLADHGLDPNCLDNQGWPPAAWAGNPEALRAILPSQSKAALTENQGIILKAWAQRAAKGFGPEMEKMVAVLSESTVVDDKTMEDSDLMKLAENFLAARASTYYSESLSFNPHAHSSRTAQSATDRLSQVYERMERRFDWRIEKKKGVSKGRWSLISAGMWALLFGERASKSSREFLGAEVHAILSRKDKSEREAWFKEEIRPGLSNQGMAGLVLFDFGRIQGLQGAARPREMLGEVLRAAIALMDGQSSKKAQDEIATLVRDYLTRAEDARHSLSGALPFLAPLVKKGLLRPSSHQYSSLAGLLVPALEEGSIQERRIAVEGALGLISLPSRMLNDSSGRARLLSNRDGMVKALLKALERSPELAMGINPENYPFANEGPIQTAVGNKNPNENLPSPGEWAAMIRQFQMEGQVPESSQIPCSPSRPKSRF